MQDHGNIDIGLSIQAFKLQEIDSRGGDVDKLSRSKLWFRAGHELQIDFIEQL